MSALIFLYNWLMVVLDKGEDVCILQEGVLPL